MCMHVLTFLLLPVQTPGRGSPLQQGQAGSPVELPKGAPVCSATPPAGAIRVGVVSQASVPSSVSAPAQQSASLPALAAAISPATVTFSQVRAVHSHCLYLPVHTMWRHFASWACRFSHVCKWFISFPVCCPVGLVVLQI